MNKEKTNLDDKEDAICIISIFLFSFISAFTCKIISWNENCYFPIDITKPFFFHRIIKIVCIFIATLIESSLIGVFGKLLYYKKAKRVYFFIILVFSIILTIINTFCLMNFHVSICPEIIDSILLTNTPEVIAWCQTYLNTSALITICTWGIIAFISFRISYKCYKQIIKNQNLIIITVGLLFLIAHNQKITSGLFHLSSFPINSLTIYSLKESSTLNNYLYKKAVQPSINKNIILDNSNIPIICLVIGESASKHFMGMYNPTYDSTPLCDNYIKKGNMFAFTDVISPKSLTHLVLPLLLSFMESDSIDKNVFHYDLLVDILKEGNYQTFWMSNQGKYSKDNDLFTENQVKHYDYSMYLAPYRVDDYLDKVIKYPHDEALLNLFDNYLKSVAKQQDKNFFVFHLIGSHFTYNNRYTKNFDKFNIKNIKYPIYDTEKKKALVAHYLNSILYTDNILNEIIKRIEKENSILIYVSDHGEELGQTGVFGHFPYPSKYMVEIPMLIYMSEKCIKSNKIIVEKIKKSLNKPFMTDCFPHMFLDLIGIKTDEFDSQKSLINPNYSSKQRIINGIKYEDLRE